MWNTLNDDTTLKGIEGKWCIDNNRLIVYVTYTNHFIDILSDIAILPTICRKGFCHWGLKPYAQWLIAWVKIQKLNYEFEKVILIGCSMGGGIVQIASNLLDDLLEESISIGGLNTTTKASDKLTLYYNKGDIVPYLGLWFKRPKKICLNTTRQGFIKAHCSYNIDIIIADIIKRN